MIVTLCGSSKFKEDFVKVAEDLTLQGYIVLMPDVYVHADNLELSEIELIRLSNLNREKINLSDAIFVINKDNYIGEETFSCIDWANRMKKSINYLIPMEKAEKNKEDEQNNTEDK